MQNRDESAEIDDVYFVVHEAYHMQSTSRDLGIHSIGGIYMHRIVVSVLVMDIQKEENVSINNEMMKYDSQVSSNIYLKSLITVRMK